MNNSFSGKVALVTGGTSGIGKATALAFARAGAKVVLSGRREKEGAQVVAEIKKLGGDAAFVRADVAKDGDVKKMVDFTVDKFGKLDVAFNNAGVEWKGSLDQATEAEYRRIFDINVWGVLNSMRHEIPAMFKNGGGAIVNNNAGVYEFVPLEEVSEPQFHRMFDTNVLGMLLVTQEALKHFNSDGGSIVNVGSLASSLTPPTAVVYNATKAAVDAITRTLAKELGPRKIRVNSINPGMVVTEGAVAGGYTEGDMRKMFESQTPLGRVGQTDDIAPAAVFFASDDSKWITGETLLIAGGLR